FIRSDCYFSHYKQKRPNKMTFFKCLSYWVHFIEGVSFLMERETTGVVNPKGKIEQ
ncbi:hypothetical protein J2T13_004063, partial [Paenibacillus sp. DS2015]